MMYQDTPRFLRSHSDGTTETGCGLPPIGALAYWDAYTSGLVPCKVTGYYRDDFFNQLHVTVRVTAARGLYRKGEKVQAVPKDVVPRSAVYVRGGQYRIRSYVWPAD
jgi:hypothetical protein